MTSDSQYEEISNALESIYLGESSLHDYSPSRAEDICEKELHRITRQLAREPDKSEFEKLSILEAADLDHYCESREETIEQIDPKLSSGETEKTAQKVRSDAKIIGRLFLQNAENHTVDNFLENWSAEHYYVLVAEYNQWSAAISNLADKLDNVNIDLDSINSVHSNQSDTIEESNRESSTGTESDSVEPKRSTGTESDSEEPERQIDVSVQVLRDLYSYQYEHYLETNEPILEDTSEMDGDSQQNRDWETIATLAGVTYDSTEGKPQSELRSDAILRSIVALLPDADSKVDRETFKENSDISVQAVVQRWGSYQNAIEAAQNQKAKYGSNPVYSDEELLNVLRDYGEPPDNPPRAKDINEQAPVSAATIYRRFDGFRAALDQAGYADGSTQRVSQAEYSQQDIIEMIQSVTTEVGWSPTTNEFDEHAEASSSTVLQYFDTWGQAKEAAGVSEITDRELQSFQDKNNHPPKDELLDEIDRLYDEIGDSMTSADVVSFGKYPAEDYETVFGSILEAMRTAGVSK